MAKDKQYRDDSARLAVLIEKYTNIPQDRVFQFVMENTADNLLPYANKLCKNEIQRQKLNTLFEFKKLYEIVKGAESREYQLDSTDAAKNYFINYFADTKGREHFAVAYLDTHIRVIKTDTISDGTVAQAHVYPREIFKEALFINASAVMIAHNHPSGELLISSQDIDVTKEIKTGMELMGLRLYDHIVVGRGDAISMEELGKIPYVNKYQGQYRSRVAIGENTKQLIKPSSIKQQLADAQRQLDSERKMTMPQKQIKDRGDR